MRQRMKQKRPSNMDRTMRKAPVLLPRLVVLGVGERSACVTAIFGVGALVVCCEEEQLDDHAFGFGERFLGLLGAKVP